MLLFLLPPPTVLAITGVGLLFFSIMSLGYARSSEQEAKVLDEAVSGLARSLQPNHRIGKLIRIPFQAIGAAASAIFSTVLLPFQFVQHAIARFQYTYDAANKGIQVGITWIANTGTSIVSTLSSTEDTR